MTESAKIAKLWASFHRLPDGHKDLIVKIAGAIAEPGKLVSDKQAVKSTQRVGKGVR
jgi:hypothetical protein